MSEIVISGSNTGKAFCEIMQSDDLQPGDEPSYQLCKLILAYHPLGQKLTETPITIAQSQERIITVPDGPEKRLLEAFKAEWEALRADEHIRNCGKLARTYGVATLGLLTAGTAPNLPADMATLADQEVAINVWDPLNTAGSLVLNQQPNELDFQKVKGVRVQGQDYHRSRTVTLLHEEPIYIQYTTSAFGYVGRSVFQRPLYMLKSFLNTLVTDDMVSLKAGVLIAKQKQPGSPMDQVMSWIAGQKREMVKEAKTFNVISIGTDEDIESLNLQNLDGAFGNSRKNIIDNIATAADMPAIIINQETYAEGFGEGTEDARRVVQYINGQRKWLQPLYAFFDEITMRRAWNPRFYKTIQADFPEQYGDVDFLDAWYRWRSSFNAVWPNLIEEPDSEKAMKSEVALKAVIAVAQVLLPMLDPVNKAKLILWLCDIINQDEFLFPIPLQLDFEELAEFLASQPAQPTTGEGGEGGQGGEPAPAPPFSARDSQQVSDVLDQFGKAVANLQEAREAIRKRKAGAGR